MVWTEGEVGVGESTLTLSVYKNGDLFMYVQSLRFRDTFVIDP